jgi:hypothetical protein
MGGRLAKHLRQLQEADRWTLPHYHYHQGQTGRHRRRRRRAAY